jgi:hypothetical protein
LQTVAHRDVRADRRMQFRLYTKKVVPVARWLELLDASLRWHDSKLRDDTQIQHYSGLQKEA